MHTGWCQLKVGRQSSSFRCFTQAVEAVPGWEGGVKLCLQLTFWGEISHPNSSSESTSSGRLSGYRLPVSTGIFTLTTMYKLENGSAPYIRFHSIQRQKPACTQSLM
ncbi:plasma membrane calcium-transporting ATPase 2-like [Platysternon megacephalum]|uniref:Plasma membrane calcium-transporting ATPase 2-like n=1 Tax=Platysternon megacephalum TaxID=55544 RepID=A0A4D9EE70_9SAUR|nr:plasma membrane calcium-transporting ATPase 2-like [Platysternon megacephalum]